MLVNPLRLHFFISPFLHFSFLISSFLVLPPPIMDLEDVMSCASCVSLVKMDNAFVFPPPHLSYCAVRARRGGRSEAKLTPHGGM